MWPLCNTPSHLCQRRLIMRYSWRIAVERHPRDARTGDLCYLVRAIGLERGCGGIERLGQRPAGAVVGTRATRSCPTRTGAAIDVRQEGVHLTPLQVVAGRMRGSLGRDRPDASAMRTPRWIPNSQRPTVPWADACASDGVVAIVFERVQERQGGLQVEVRDAPGPASGISRFWPSRFCGRAVLRGRARSPVARHPLRVLRAVGTAMRARNRFSMSIVPASMPAA